MCTMCTAVFYNIQIKTSSSLVVELINESIVMVLHGALQYWKLSLHFQASRYKENHLQEVLHVTATRHHVHLSEQK